jgi:N-acetylneuraminate synthase
MNKIFSIAEIGINHNGDLKIAKEMISHAKNCGFNSVKFQKRTIDLVYSKEILSQFRESPWGKTNLEQKNGLEFNEDQYKEIDNYCKELKIEWFASAWDIKSLEFLDAFKLNKNKIASAMIVDLDFLKEVAKRKKHTFISTGMSTTNDIDNAVKIFEENNCPYELMHSVSTYPMKIENANLITIKHLKERYKCNVGYSGHESGLGVSLAAVGFDISSLERHITLDRSMYGSDQSASLEPKGMSLLIKYINEMKIAEGENSLGKIFDEELPIAKKLRAHIYKK